MIDRRCFIQHFLLCLAATVIVFFAYLYDIPQLIWTKDLSHVTSAIATLFVAMSFYTGWLAWHVEDWSREESHQKLEFIWFVEERFLRVGLLGTVIGLSMQANEMSNGLSGLLPLSTSLFSTAAGIVASLALSLMAYNIKSGLER